MDLIQSVNGTESRNLEPGVLAFVFLLEDTIGHDWLFHLHRCSQCSLSTLLSPIHYLESRNLIVPPSRVNISIPISASMALFPMGDVMRLDALWPENLIGNFSCQQSPGQGRYTNPYNSHR